jgi:hypothetical protein
MHPNQRPAKIPMGFQVGNHTFSALNKLSDLGIENSYELKQQPAEVNGQIVKEIQLLRVYG